MFNSYNNIILTYIGMAKQLKCPSWEITHLFFKDVVSHSFFALEINEGVKYVDLHMVSVQQYRSYTYTYLYEYWHYGASWC